MSDQLYSSDTSYLHSVIGLHLKAALKIVRKNLFHNVNIEIHNTKYYVNYETKGFWYIQWYTCCFKQKKFLKRSYYQE